MAKTKFEPTPAGWLVTGHRSIGVHSWIAPVKRCERHLFLTGEPKPNSHWQSGWVQGATCVVCGEDVTPVDASWWTEIASEAKIRAARRMVRARQQSLAKTLAMLSEHLCSGDYA